MEFLLEEEAAAEFVADDTVEEDVLPENNTGWMDPIIKWLE